MSWLAMSLVAVLPLREVKTIEVDRRNWEYVVARPPGKAKGLILAMHGAGGSGPQFDESAAWSDKATEAGFAVVCPSGQPSRAGVEADFKTNPRVWNSGQLNPRSPRTKVDDLKALDAIVGECQKEVGNLPLFLSGHSNGAGMAFYVAYHWQDRITGMGMMSGNLLFDLEGNAKKPIPTLWIVGEKDPLSPFDGGKTTMPLWGTEKENRPVMETAKNWAAWMDGIGNLSFSVEKDGVKQLKFGQSVLVLECLGHGHAWPGGKKGELPASIVGPDVTKLDATDELLKFFGKQINKA